MASVKRLLVSTCAAVAASLMLGGVWGGIAAQSTAKNPTADQLIARVLEARHTSGFRSRAKLTRTSTGSDVRISRQLLIRGREDGHATMVSYQVIWPKEITGHAVVITDAGDHHPTGFVYDGHAAAPLTKPTLISPLFDSDLRVEDVLEGFWYWPSPHLEGDEAIDKRHCVWIDFRPGPDTATAYTKVRACVAPDLALPLRIELFGADGALVKHVTADRIVRHDSRWMVATVTVTPADGLHQTVLEGSRYEDDLQIPASEFTVDAIANFSRTLGRGAGGGAR